METLAIRVDNCRDQVFEDVVQWIKRNSEKSFLYREKGAVTGKEHFQGVIDLDLSVKSLHAWAKNLKDLVKPPGKNQYSLATMKKPEYKVYCTKDKDRVFQLGYTDEELMEYENASYSKVSVTTDEKKMPFADKMYKDIVKDIVRFRVDVLGNKEMIAVDERKLQRYIVEYMCKNTKVYDKFVLVRFFHLMRDKLYMEYMGGIPDDLITRYFENI